MLRLFGKEFSLWRDDASQAEIYRTEHPVFLTPSFCLPYPMEVSVSYLMRRKRKSVPQKRRENGGGSPAGLSGKSGKAGSHYKRTEGAGTDRQRKMYRKGEDHGGGEDRKASFHRENSTSGTGKTPVNY